MAQDKTQTKKEIVRDLIHELAYQQAPGIHTYSRCSAKGCEKSARGGLTCKKHTKEKLAKLIGCPRATKLSMFYHHRMILQANIEDLTEIILDDTK